MRTLTLGLLMAAALATAAVATSAYAAGGTQTPQMMRHHHYHYMLGRGYYRNQDDYLAEWLNHPELDRLGVVH